MEKYYTVQDIADLLQVHVVTVRRWILSGQLKAIKLDKEYRITKSDLEKFLDVK